MALGNLVVELSANIAKFESDLQRAVGVANKNLGGIAAAAKTTATVLTGLASILASRAVLNFAEDLVTSTARLGELSKSTGLSVTAMSALTNVAKQTGGDVESAAMSFDKMQKLAFQAAGGSQAAKNAFNAIGVSADELTRGLAEPDKLLLTVAQHLEQYRDDGNKTAEMQLLFGRSGAQQAEMLARIATEGYSAATATAREADEARRLNEEMNRTATDIKSGFVGALTSITPVLRVFGVGVIATFEWIWLQIKYGWELMWANLGDAALTLGGKLISKLPGQAAAQAAAAMQAAGSGASTAKLRQDRADALAQNRRVMDQAVADMDRALHGPGVQLPDQRRAIAPPPGAGAARLAKMQMTEFVRSITDAVKAEEQAYKLVSGQLDEDYANGLTSLADYSTEKVDALTVANNATLALYDREIAGLQKYIAAQTDARAKEQGIADLKIAIDNRAAAALKGQENELALRKELQKTGADYSKILTDLDIKYATVNGDTAAATALQIALEDGHLRAALAANGQADALAKLDKVEQDRRLHAARDPVSGITRAIQDYVKNVGDLGKQTEALTTNMLNGMTDALVKFVTTGKLSFKSMIDSMIADIARLVIQQQISAPIASWIGAGISSLGSTFSAGGGEAATAAFATGGSFNVGGAQGVDQNIVRFRATAGETVTVTPRGSQGRGGLVFAPVYNIDSRADRAQIRSDMDRISRNHIQQLSEQLLRYNEGLRV